MVQEWNWKRIRFYFSKLKLPEQVYTRVKIHFDKELSMLRFTNMLRLNIPSSRIGLVFGAWTSKPWTTRRFQN